MELPTYTGIWRIEKRLYKLYDFRLPMPLPVGQIAVFAAITVPYIVLLTLFGLPFNHNLFWLYVLPPGLLTWLATRPVLESKRLPELIISQARYMGEPSTWCRMAPLAEKDEIVVFGRVWRRGAVAPAVTAEQEAIEQREAARELLVPEQAALPTAGAAAELVSGQPVGERPVAEQAARGRVSAGRRERQARERQRRVREGKPAGPAQEQRVRETAEAPGMSWGRRAAGTVRRQGVPGPAAPGSPASGQAAVPVGEVQRPPAADAGWTRGAGPVADAAVRRDGVAVAPSRAGRHAGPSGPAAAVGYPADTGVRPEGVAVEPRPVGEAGRGNGAGAIGYAGAGGYAGRVSDPGPVGNGDRSASRSEDPGVAGFAGATGLADAAGVAGATGLAGTIGYATGASARRAPDTGAVGDAAGRDGEPCPDAGPGAGVPGTVGYMTGAGARPGGPVRDSGPSERAGTGWPTEPPAPRPAEQQSSAAPALAPQAPASRPTEPRPLAPVTTVPGQGSAAGPPPTAPVRPRPAPVEDALSGPGEHRSAGWRGHVTVVSGGRGPGRPDHVKEARSRAVLPLDRPRLVVVLGCTVGAGQTVTALMLADLLAGLRAEPVAALDLNPGPASLTELAGVPTITVSALLADRAPGAHAAHRGPAGPAGGNRTRSRLDVICQDADADNPTMPGLQFDRLAGVLASRYTLTLADPGAPSVAKVLAEAGQLVLVAPASPDAARAVSMTCEWLSGHGHAALAKHSIAVLNGVSQRSVRHAEQAELVLRGRSRAIVRVPWDDHLAEPQAGRGIRGSLEAADGEAMLARLRPAVLQAYTALAGVLVSSLGDDPARRKVAR